MGYRWLNGMAGAGAKLPYFTPPATLEIMGSFTDAAVAVPLTMRKR